MGVPKFYRWLSERYPLINQPVKVSGAPEMDNFYLDMNGIVHQCSHGNDSTRTFTEEQMIGKVFNYIDRLFHMVKPRKLVFMAIDGVAPRAKMNQQRSRRFKAGRERQLAIEEKMRKGEDVAGHAFDSNCITPGTEFMARLTQHLLFFVRKKMAEDPAWRVPEVVVSGPEVPGEGEHKIMEHIRVARLSPDWAPNQRHCLYGLDADLIMLSLVTHEPHFCLLREVVSFTGGNRGQPAREVIEDPSEDHFVLLQVGILRDYLDLELRNDSMPFPFSLENAIDDFVLFCMLVGNDFLPALPTLDIGEGGLDTLLALYKELLPQLGGYLTLAGKLNRGRLERLLGEFGRKEREILEERAADAADFERKRGRKGRTVVGPRTALPKPGMLGLGPIPGASTWRQQFKELQDAAMAQNGEKEGEETESGGWLTVGATSTALEDEGEDEDELPQHMAGPTMMAKEARDLLLAGHGDAGMDLWRQRYYTDKLHLPDAGPESRTKVVTAYLEGLHWVLEYYYRGVASWEWFYPFHFSPPASDLVGLACLPVHFRPGQPFRPFQQLLSVMPPSSADLLPEPYRWLMRSPMSPIRDFYPEDFQIDYEGKRADWEGVALICFIDERRLLEAEATHVGEARLTEEEKKRNAEGLVYTFAYDAESTEASFCASTCPSLFPSVHHSHSRATPSSRPPPLRPDQPGFGPALVPGTSVGTAAPPGFPTIFALPVSKTYMLGAVSIFGFPSKKESLVVVPRGVREALGGEVTADIVASNARFMRSRCFIRFPWLQEAQVSGVSDGAVHITSQGTRRVLDRVEAVEWQEEADDIKRKSLGANGILLEDIPILVHVRPVEGLSRRIDGTVEKRFSRVEVRVPLQLIVRDHQAADKASAAAVRSLMLFPTGMHAVFLGKAHYGCLCQILGPSSKSVASAASSAAVAYRVRLETQPPKERAIAQSARHTLTAVAPQELRLHDVTRKLNVDFRVVATLSSSFWVRTGSGRDDRVDIGLTVKMGRQGLCVPDYARPDKRSIGADGQPKGWVFTPSMLRVLEAYKAKFPWVFAACEAFVGSESREHPRAWDVLPELEEEAAVAKVKEAHAWVKQQGPGKRPLVPGTAHVAWDQAVRALQGSLSSTGGSGGTVVELDEVMPALLLPPLDVHSPLAELAGGEFALGDRVVSISTSSAPPFGSKGTVVGVYEGFCEVLFDIPFVGGTDLFGRCDGDQGLLASTRLLLNLSKPKAIETPKQYQPALVGTTRQVQEPKPASAKAVPTKVAPQFKSIGDAIDAVKAKISRPQGTVPPPAPPPGPPMVLLRPPQPPASPQRPQPPQGQPPSSPVRHPPAAPPAAVAAPRQPPEGAGQWLIRHLQAASLSSPTKQPPPPQPPAPPPSAPHFLPPPPASLSDNASRGGASQPNGGGHAVLALLSQAARSKGTAPPAPAGDAAGSGGASGSRGAAVEAVHGGTGEGGQGGSGAAQKERRDGRGGREGEGGRGRGRGRGREGTAVVVVETSTKGRGKGRGEGGRGRGREGGASQGGVWGGAHERTVDLAMQQASKMARAKAAPDEEAQKAMRDIDAVAAPSGKEEAGQTIEGMFQEMQARMRAEAQARMGSARGAQPAPQAREEVVKDPNEFWRLLGGK